MYMCERVTGTVLISLVSIANDLVLWTERKEEWEGGGWVDGYIWVTGGVGIWLNIQ